MLIAHEGTPGGESLGRPLLYQSSSAQMLTQDQLQYLHDSQRMPVYDRMGDAHQHSIDRIIARYPNEDLPEISARSLPRQVHHPERQMLASIPIY
jgi:hypothetical protein